MNNAGKGIMSASAHFAQVPTVQIERSTFDRTHGYKTTFNAGYLVPIFFDEALPGDTFHLSLTAFARMTTQLKPIMDNLFMDFFFFFVPNRLIWANFKKFMGEQVNPGDSISYSVPQCTGPAGNGILSNTLHDYLGLPVGKASVVFNNLHPRAYNLIWNEWFRDQNLQNSVTVDTGDGPDTYGNYVLLQRGKRHDYFTSCLPWPQKGTAVSLPLGTTAPVIMNPTTGLWPIGKKASDHTIGASGAISLDASGNLQNSGATNITLDPGTGANSAWLADLNNATAATINALRQSFQTQKFLERDARGGTRYTEIIRSHFGVVSPDARLQRPEYLGGGSVPINITPIAQSSVSINNQAGNLSPQGNMAGYATSVAHGIGFTKSFTEHGVLIGLVSVRADLTYQQGLDRFWQRRTRYDYYWPEFAHIGEQSVTNNEIYCNMDSNDALVFGYQERYAEYRYKPSKITGLYRSNVGAGSTSLDLWHLSQNFGALPVLGNTFIVENPPMSRIVAVTTEPHFYYDSIVKLICARPMPVFGVPGFIDHF